MIEARDIGLQLPTGQWLWRHLDIAVEPASVVGMIGRNGSGKTTLIRTLLGLIQPDEGKVRPGLIAGYVPQRTGITFPFSVRDIVGMGRARHIGLFRTLSSDDRRIIDRAMERTEIFDLAERPFFSLSGGEQQLVLIARAIATECDTLVLDEPFTGLDLENQCLTLSLMKRLSSEDGLAILFSAHQPDHLYVVADQALVLQKGRPSLQGSVQEMLTPTLLSDVYGVEVQVVNLDRDTGCSRHAVPYLHANMAGRIPDVEHEIESV